MFYLRVFLIFCWVTFCCVAILLMSPFFYGDFTLNRRMAHMLAWGIFKITGTTLETEGTEKIAPSQPCIYVCNHQSMFDVATFGSVFPDHAVIVGKRELVWLPLFGLFFLAAGNIPIDRQKRTKAVASLGKVVDTIRRHRVAVWVFPEGTRSHGKPGLLPFKKGAFHMALQARIPILPIVSGPLGPLYDWKERRITPGKLKLRVLDVIPTDGYEPGQTDELAAAVREKMLAGLPGPA